MIQPMSKYQILYRINVSPYRISALVALMLLAGCASNDKPSLSIAPPPHETSGNPIAAAEALRLQGKPYVSGGESPNQGFDCSGLVYYVYNRQGLRLPRDTLSLAKQLPAIQPEQRQPGDLVFFNTHRPFSHVGIYIGEDRFVHAPSQRTGRVMVSDLNQPYWRERFVAVRRPTKSQPLSLNESDICWVN